MSVDNPASAPLAMRYCLTVVGERIARMVAEARADGDVADSQRGVYFPPELIVRDARALPFGAAASVVNATDLPPRLVELGARLELTDVDLALLLIAAAVNIEPRFEHFFIVLNNEVDTRAPMVATALRLAGCSVDDPAARSRLRADAPLLRHGLLECGPADRPRITQLLTVPERVVDYLLGDDQPDPLAAGVMTPLPSEEFSELRLPEFPLPTLPVAFRARAGSAGLLQASRLATVASGRPPIIVSRLSQTLTQAESEVAACVREAGLTGRAIVVDARGFEQHPWLSDGPTQIVHAGIPLLVVVGPRARLGSWQWSVVDLPLPRAEVRRQWWLGLGASAELADAHAAVTHLDPEGIAGVIRTGHAPVMDWPATHVQRVEPAFDLGEVLTSATVRGELADLADRVRSRSVVLDEWGMRPGGGRGRGVTALFTGAPGTGKTMAAEALAGELRVALFRVDLATVIDKYIGETEKNLDKVFTSVENSDAVLLFDEADALFGRRSEVSDARDRYANIEVAYLLQRMEAFDGLAILTTNLRANLDPAFLRRLDAVIDFPEPTVSDRRELWTSCLRSAGSHLSPELLDELAEVPLTGGSIRAAAVSAAYFAAAQARPIDEVDLRRATDREWRKLGRLARPTASPVRTS